MRESSDFRNYYEIGEKLGESNFGIVYEAKKIGTEEKSAIEIIEKEKLKKIYRNRHIKEPNELELQPYINCFLNVINNMKICEGKNKENKNIVKFYEYFNTKNEFAIVMELCDENMMNYLSRKFNQLTRKEKYDIIDQLNNTFKIMADNKITHRDIKLENILLKYENKEKTKYTVKLKLTDGSEMMTQIRKEICSMANKNLNFCIYSPEILREEKYNEKHNEKCDLWSIGIIIYLLYFKDYPFKGVTKEAVLNQINQGDKNLLSTSDPILDDLIKKVLNKNVNKRLSWKEYFNHVFFKQNQDYKLYYELEKELGKTDLAVVYQAKLKENNEKRAIKIYRKNLINTIIKRKNFKNQQKKT